MSNFENYYKVTQNKKPSKLIQTFFMSEYDNHLENKKAVDLGCGTGVDTQFLLSHGFEVTAIDNQSQVEEIFQNKSLNTEKLKLIIDDFSKIEIPNADLILANMSLFFVTENFDFFIQNLLTKVNSNGFILANFLGEEDEWAKRKTTVKKDELLDYFKGFKMFYFSEEKYYKKTADGINKFWHVYTVIAQKTPL